MYAKPGSVELQWSTTFLCKHAKWFSLWNTLNIKCPSLIQPPSTGTWQQPGCTKWYGTCSEEKPFIKVASCNLSIWYLSKEGEEWGLSCDTNPYILSAFWREQSHLVLIICLGLLLFQPCHPLPGGWLGCLSASGCAVARPLMQARGTRSLSSVPGCCCACGHACAEGHKYGVAGKDQPF